MWPRTLPLNPHPAPFDILQFTRRAEVFLRRRRYSSSQWEDVLHEMVLYALDHADQGYLNLTVVFLRARELHDPRHMSGGKRLPTSQILVLDDGETIERGTTANNVTEAAIAAMDWEKLLAQLTPTEQSIVHRYYVEGWRLREIAAADGVNESRISQRLTALCAKLRQYLQKKG